MSNLFAVWLLAMALGGVPSLGTHSTETSQKAKKVWTNDDNEELRARVHLSEFSTVPAAAAPARAAEKPVQAAPAIPAEPASPEEVSRREKDPKWYAKQMADLRAELARIDEEILRLRDFRTSGEGMRGGLVLNQTNIGITPEDSIAILENRKREIHDRIDQLEELARRNDIPPGMLR